MKTIFRMLGLAMALTAAPLLATNPVDLESWVGSTNAGTTKAEVLFGANAARAVRLAYLDAKSDLAGSIISCRAGEVDQLVISNSVAAAATVFVASTTPFAVNDVIFLQTASNSVATATVSAVVNATNLTVSPTFANPATIGDRIFRMSTPTTFDLGATTVRLSSDNLYHAPRGRPLLVNVNGTSACKINRASVLYDGAQ